MPDRVVPSPVAIDSGFHLGDPLFLGLASVGVVLFVAIDRRRARLPFVLLGVSLATRHDGSWLGEWAAADLLYRSVVAVLIGVLGGRGIAGLLMPLGELYGREFDG